MTVEDLVWERGGLQYKAVRKNWNEAEHPRDSRGKFIEIGGRVRLSSLAGGGEGTVRKNVGGGNFEVERDGGAGTVQVNRRYLTVVARPGGGKPTADPEAAKPAPVKPASADVPEATADAVPAAPAAAAAPDKPAQEDIPWMETGPVQHDSPSLGAEGPDWEVEVERNAAGWAWHAYARGRYFESNHSKQNYPTAEDAQEAVRKVIAKWQEGPAPRVSPDSPLPAAPIRKDTGPKPPKDLGPVPDWRTVMTVEEDEDGDWQVMHTPTGKALTAGALLANSREQAEQIAAALMDARNDEGDRADWTISDPKLMLREAISVQWPKVMQAIINGDVPPTPTPGGGTPEPDKPKPTSWKNLAEYRDYLRSIPDAAIPFNWAESQPERAESRKKFLGELAGSKDVALSKDGKVLVFKRAPGKWSIATSSTVMHVPMVGDMTTRKDALALAEAVQANLHDADGNPFPWDSPDVNGQVGTWRSDRDETIQRGLARVRAETPGFDKDGFWAAEVARHKAATDPAPDPVTPDPVPDPVTPDPAPEPEPAPTPDPVVTPDPVPVDEPKLTPARAGRPPLYAYQRRNINSYRFDTDHPDDDVRAAARAVRYYEPLTAVQASALAGALRQRGQDDGGARAAKSAETAAARLDVLAGSLNAADSVPEGPRQPAHQLAGGARVAVPETTTGKYVEGTVVSSKIRYAGRVVELEIRDDATGETVTRQIMRGTQLRQLTSNQPDQPEDRDEDQGDDSGAFAATAIETSVNDYVAFEDGADMVQGRVISVEPGARSGRTVLTIQPDDGGEPTVHDLADDAEVWALLQPEDEPVPDPEPVGPETVTKETVRVGDTIQQRNAVTGEAWSGVVIGMKPVADVGDGTGEGVDLEVMFPDGDVDPTSLWLIGDEKLELLDRPDGDGAEYAARFAQERRDAHLLASTAEGMRKLDAIAIRAAALEVANKIADADGPLGSGPLSADDIAQAVLDSRQSLRSKFSLYAETAAGTFYFRASGDRSDEQDNALSVRRPLVEVQGEAITRLYESVQNVPDAAAAARIIQALAATGPTGDPEKASSPGFEVEARNLIAAIRQLPADAGATDVPTNGPSVDDIDTGSGSIAERVARIRAALPADSADIGKRVVRATRLPRLTIEQLRSGELPAPEVEESKKSDLAKDGGPGVTTMRQLAAVKAAGRVLDDSIQAKVREALGGEPQEFIRQAELDADNARRAYNEEMTRNNEALATAQREAVQSLGYRSTAAYEARREQLRQEALRMRLGSEERNATLAELDRLAEEVRKLQRERMESSNATRAQARQAYIDANTAKKEAGKRVAGAAREAAVAALAEVRSMGPQGDAKMSYVQGDRSATVKALRWAEQHYPTEWLEKASKLTLTTKKVKRGYYNHSLRAIALSEQEELVEGAGSMGDVAVHELGHHMERMVPGVTALEEAFLWSRTTDAGTDIGARTRTGKNAPRSLGGGMARELSRQDEFPQPYSGKEYQGYAYELLTTSVEGLFGGQTKYVDADMRAWALGVLAVT